MRITGLPLLLALLILAGCSSQPFKNGFPAQDNWVVLPIQSLEIAEYGTQTERILKVLLAQKGIAHIVIPPETDVQGNNILLSGAHRLTNAEAWAKQHNNQFGLTGSVDYAATDGSGRFRINLTLRLINLSNDSELWIMSGESEGKPREEPIMVIRNLLSGMLSNLPLDMTKTTQAKPTT